ncbi:hydrolase TatD [Chryseobacterium indologenes]|uniref:Hydrolase TatD n=1 Tax=Chryseobacterium indologenes TaxID=253 RepID=A0AAD0YZG9_CHRID|nr:TatD family hydrolase [Chryseobacterium indologenes]AYZ37117.1 hydrolase TatD [Chryseobacterium indologenes]AZB19756.1 hydrolase TatD [Chryseobacterium indologenes]MBF6645965.1 TatD family hydrolase [Chryseobacterium indologenes]MBU3048268.1 TatD family hydrolase [Chryseobacterium indologenes]MEB4761012.1 TatD family hydrolase [Chryseobacterium indologenes]
MNTYIDIGINLTNKQFCNEHDEIINRALDQGVDHMILTGTSVRGSKESARIAEEYPDILFSTAGIHPHDAKSLTDQSIRELKNLLEQDHVISVGECGLDFDRDFSPRPIQEKCYKAQLELAIEVNKPLFLHERAAFKRLNEITDEYISQLPEAAVHCFTGTLDEAKIYLDKGFYLGFTGAISDERRFKHLEEVIRYVPLDRMMIETDAPFMLPKNMPRIQNRRNEPSFLPYVAQTIARLKRIEISEVADETTETARQFFRI